MNLDIEARDYVLERMRSSPAAKAYESTAHILRDRIVELIREKPEALLVRDPFDLFKHGLQCDDLTPSLGQAGWALAAAKKIAAN